MWVALIFCTLVLSFAASTNRVPINGIDYQPVIAGEQPPPCSVLTTFLAQLEQRIWHVLSKIPAVRKNDTTVGWPWLLEKGNRRHFFEYAVGVMTAQVRGELYYSPLPPKLEIAILRVQF